MPMDKYFRKGSGGVCQEMHAFGIISCKLLKHRRF